MTLPNKLTLVRILIVPVMIIIACVPYLRNHTLWNSITFSNFINVLLFALASITDFLDGHIARKHNLVTTFGKFADPLADKMLVLISFLILLEQRYSFFIGDVSFVLVPMWAVAIILLRELIVSGVRLVAAEKGKVIAAGWAGKVKTFETMITIIFLFLQGIHISLDSIGLVMLYISVILTVYSGAEYVWNSRKIIFESF